MECKIVYVEDLETEYDLVIYEDINKIILEDMIEENMHYIPRID